MMNQTFAPFLFLLLGIVVGGLGFALGLSLCRWARRHHHPDPALPHLNIRLIDHIEPVPTSDRKWYTDQLTPRELEIAVRAARGERTADIARSLVISPHTVETHIKNIYRKLEVSSRLELAHALADLRLDDTGPRPT